MLHNKTESSKINILLFIESLSSLQKVSHRSCEIFKDKSRAQKMVISSYQYAYSHWLLLKLLIFRLVMLKCIISLSDEKQSIKLC